MGTGNRIRNKTKSKTKVQKCLDNDTVENVPVKLKLRVRMEKEMSQKSAYLNTHILFIMSSVYDPSSLYYVCAPLNKLQGININKLAGSCPSDREASETSIYDDEGERKLPWKELNNKEMMEFTRKNHCQVLCGFIDE